MISMTYIQVFMKGIFASEVSMSLALLYFLKKMGQSVYRLQANLIAEFFLENSNKVSEKYITKCHYRLSAHHLIWLHQKENHPKLSDMVF